MDLTPEQFRFALYGDPQATVTEEPQPSGSIFGRGLEHLGNLPGEVLNTGMQAAVNLGLAPTSRKIPRAFDIPQAKTTTEKVVDAIGGTLLPQLGWAAATYGIGGAFGKVAGLSEAGTALGLSEAGQLTRSGTVAADVIGNVTSGFASGATQSSDQAVMGALFGGAYGAGSWLPRAQRVLPMVGIGAADAMAAYSQSGDLGMSALQGGLGATIGMLAHGLQPELPEALLGSERGRATQFEPQRPHWPGAASTEDVPLGPYGPPLTKVTGDQIGFSRRISGIDPDPGPAWPDILQPGESPYPPAGPPKRPMRIPEYPNPDPGVVSPDITREGSLLGIGHINRYENNYDRSNEVETLQALGFNPPVRPKRPAQVSANAIIKQGGGSLPVSQEESLVKAATSSLQQDEATKNIMRQLGLLDENVDEETIKNFLQAKMQGQFESPEKIMHLRNQDALVTLQKEAENIVYPVGTTKREMVELGRQAEGNQVALADFRARKQAILAKLHGDPTLTETEKVALTTKAKSFDEAEQFATGTGGAAPVTKSIDDFIAEASRMAEAERTAKEVTPLTPLKTAPPLSESSGGFNISPSVIGGAVGSTLGYAFGGETDEERAYGAAKYGALGFGLGYVGHALPGIARALERPVSKFGGISERGGVIQLGQKVIQDETPLIKFKRDLAILQEQRMAGVQDPDLSRKIANLEGLVQQFTPPEVPGTMIRVAGRPNELPSPFTNEQLPWAVPNARSEQPLESSARVLEGPLGTPLEVSDKLQRQREARFNAEQAKKKAVVDNQRTKQRATEISNVTNLKDKHAALVALQGGELASVKTGELDYKNADWLDEEIAPVRSESSRHPTVKELEQRQRASGMKQSKGKASEQGYVKDRFIIPLAGTFTGAVTGGTYGYKESQGDLDDTALGAVLGGLAGGILSHTALRLLMPELTKSQKAIVSEDSFGQALVKIFSEPAKDQAGKQVFGDPTEASKLLRALEKNGANVPAMVKGKLTQAQGAILHHVALLRDVVKRTKNFDVPDSVKAAATNFIEGQSLDPAALEAEIIRQGGVDSAGWSALKKAGAQPSDYHSWDVGDETFYMEPKTFEQVLKKSEEEFRSRVPAEFSDYADLMVTSRNSMNALQEAFALGLGGKRGQQIKSSIGKHIIKAYDFFEDPKFHPTKAGIDIAAAAESNTQKGRLIEKYIKGTAINDWRMMTEQTYQKALKSASPSQLVTLQKYKPVDFAGSSHPNIDAPAGKYYAGPEAFEKIRTTTDATSLAQRIKQWTDDRKEDELWGVIGEKRPEGKDFIDTNLLTKRNTFTPEFEKHVLGVITDPYERMRHSINRLVESAVSSKYVDEIKHMTLPNGLKAAYENQSDYIATRDVLANSLNSAPPDQVREIQSKLNELLTYKNVDNTGLKLGVLKDAMVSRYVHDQLKNYNGTGLGVWDKLGGGIVQSFNRFAKVVHAPYNPIVQIQNLVTAPMHMWMGRAHPIDAWNAARALMEKGDLYKEGLREGIIGADEVTNAMTKDMNKIVNSHYDNKALDKLISPFQKVHEGILSAFRAPDTLTRLATYVSAKSRFAEKLGLPLDHPDVIANAVIWTDRYTVNHSNLSPVVKGLRKVPFVNIYIGYATEMARIGKNLAEDVWKGDAFGDRIHAMAILGTLAGAAEGAQALSEAQLSPEDRKLWNQTQALSPDYSRSRYKFVTGKDKDNNFYYLDYTNLINTSAYNQMIRSIGSGDFEGFWAVNPVVGWQNTPAYRIIAEQIAGKNLSTQRDFRGFDDRVKAIAGAMLPSLTPSVGYEWQKWEQALNGEENMKTGRKFTVEGQITSYLTSVGVTSVNSDTVKRNAFQKFQNEKALQRQYLNDVLKMKGIGEDVKNREINKYQEAIKYLTANLLDKIEAPVPRG